MRDEFIPGTDMQRYYEHPTEDALERFLLHQLEESELEVLETHILACHACVERLEGLETQIAVTKSALGELQREARTSETAKASGGWRRWFSVPVLSWAAAATAAVALCVAAFLPAQVSLSAYRGTESTVAPQWRPLSVHLNANDVANGRVAVELVDAAGAQMWTGAAQVNHEQVEVHLPRIYKAGSYFVRLYEAGATSGQGDLLREFPLRVK